MPKSSGPRRDNSRPYTPERLLSLSVHHEVRRRTQALSAFKDKGDPQAGAIEPAAPLAGEASGRHWPEAYGCRLARPHDSSHGGISPFAKDYSRIVHSSAFRRLQGKTQLIPAGENEVFRTRLTHSLEVADIASRIAATLNHRHAPALGAYRIDQDIVACASLLHDLGHPPFGHSGEAVLNERMREHGGFEGNAQTLRIVSCLENRLGLIEDRSAAAGAIAQAEALPRGMNLTAGTLAAVVKYPRQLGKAGRGAMAGKGIYEEEMPVIHALQALGLGLSPQRRTLECQIMDIADDIAYSAYDLEDTLEAGIVTPLDLVAPDDDLLDAIRSEEGVREGLGRLAADKEAKEAANSRIVQALTQVFASLFDLGDAYPEIQVDSVDGNRARHIFVARTYLESVMHARHPMVRRQFLEALIESHVAAIDIVVDPAAPHFSSVVVAPQSKLRIECLKAFNYHRVINSRRLQMVHYRSHKIVGELFDTLFENAMARDPKICGLLLPDRMREQLLAQGRRRAGSRQAARLVADHVSSLTDTEALRLHAQLTSGQPATFNAYWR